MNNGWGSHITITFLPFSTRSFYDLAFGFWFPPGSSKLTSEDLSWGFSLGGYVNESSLASNFFTFLLSGWQSLVVCPTLKHEAQK